MCHSYEPANEIGVVCHVVAVDIIDVVELINKRLALCAGKKVM